MPPLKVSALPLLLISAPPLTAPPPPAPLRSRGSPCPLLAPPLFIAPIQQRGSPATHHLPTPPSLQNTPSTPRPLPFPRPPPCLWTMISRPVPLMLALFQTVSSCRTSPSSRRSLRLCIQRTSTFWIRYRGAVRSSCSTSPSRSPPACSRRCSPPRPRVTTASGSGRRSASWPSRSPPWPAASTCTAA